MSTTAWPHEARLTINTITMRKVRSIADCSISRRRSGQQRLRTDTIFCRSCACYEHHHAHRAIEPGVEPGSCKRRQLLVCRHEERCLEEVGVIVWRPVTDRHHAAWDEELTNLSIEIGNVALVAHL